MLPWYQPNVLWGRGKLLYHINRTQGHEWGECCMIGEECVRDPYIGQQGLWMAYLTAQIAFMMSHLKYQFPPVLIPFKVICMCENLITGLSCKVLRETKNAMLRWTIKISVYLSNYLTIEPQTSYLPSFLILHIFSFLFTKQAWEI